MYEQDHATVEPRSDSSLPAGTFSYEIPSNKPGIRHRLRQWEAENAATYVPTMLTVDAPQPGAIHNSLTRSQSGDFRADDEGGESDVLPEQIFDQDGLVDVGSKRSFLLPGDLVELSYVCPFAT